MLPIRCFSCNKILGRYQTSFEFFKNKYSFMKECDIPYEEYFKEYDIERYCCRKIFLTYICHHETSQYYQEVLEPMPKVEIRHQNEVVKMVFTD